MRDNRHRTSPKSPRNIWWFIIDFSGQVSFFQIVIISVSLIMAVARDLALLFMAKIIFGQRSFIIISTYFKPNTDFSFFSLFI
jgi:hypothetical protein